MSIAVISLLVVLILINILVFLKIGRVKPSQILKQINDEISGDLEKLKSDIDKNFNQNRQEFLKNASNDRQELNNSILQNSTNFSKVQNQTSEQLLKQLENFEVKSTRNASENRQEMEKKLDSIRKTVEDQLKSLQKENGERLEKMRHTVDEKLQATVEKRFNQSFNVIATRLDQVHKGLGEMQNLASGVGDLKKVLSNVKTRGNIGEIQLESILEQFFSPSQYEKNATTKSSSTQRVEFALKIPDKGEEDKDLLLPIDSKFPIEDYQRLVEAYEAVDYTNQQSSKLPLDQALRQFESSVKRAAKEISDKYLNPPVTTDFAIMFVPTEGLYAEILRNNNLFDELQRKYRVIVLGPTTIVAFLSALQMGFRTLAVEKRSSEVWNILASVKSEFGKFGDLLEKTKKKLQETGNVIDSAAVKSRNIERRLKDVQIAPDSNSDKLENSANDLTPDCVKIED